VFNRTGYLAHSEEISAGRPWLGRAYLLPWDTETFGFPVATYETEAAELDSPSQKEFSQVFHSWAERHGVQLCSCAIPADDSFWKAFLPEMGFRFVDLGLQATLNGLRSARLPEPRTKLRLAAQEDWDAIEEIASNSFHHGRYHADPLLPRELADLRYRQWIRRALAGDHEIDRVYVMEEAGAIQGFYHVTVEDGVSDLRLAAVSLKLQGTMLGFDLYVSVLHSLKNLGLRRVLTSISSTNTAVMNIYSMLGFQFSKPKIIYHWHPQTGPPETGMVETNR